MLPMINLLTHTAHPPSLRVSAVYHPCLLYVFPIADLTKKNPTLL